MTEKLLTFTRKEPEEESIPHVTGPAVCLACSHKWVFVQPAPGTLDLECPSCHMNRGKRAGLTMPGANIWVCLCTNDLFLVTADAVFCPQCGTFQNFGSTDRRS